MLPPFDPTERPFAGRRTAARGKVTHAVRLPVDTYGDALCNTSPGYLGWADSDEPVTCKRCLGILRARGLASPEEAPTKPQEPRAAPACWGPSYQHVWEPMERWGGRYKCSTCHAVGYHQLVTGYGSEITAYVCQTPGCHAAALHAHQRQFCSKHLPRKGKKP